MEQKGGNRQELIESLLAYLPSLSSSVNKLLELLTKVLDLNSNFPDNKSLLEIYRDLEGIIAIIEKLSKHNSLNKENLGEHEDIYVLYASSMKCVIDGIKLMLQWIKVKGEPEVTLKESIDQLFIGSQIILSLVDKLLSE